MPDNYLDKTMLISATLIRSQATKSCIVRCGALLVMLASAGQVPAAAPMKNETIWDVIAAMRTMPITEKTVRELFGSRIDTRDDNGYWTFHEGKGGRLGDGVTIDRFGFTTKNDSSALPGIYMNVTGRCIKIEEVMKAYPGASALPPSAHSRSVGYVYTSREGKLSFAFKSDQPFIPSCLENVGFYPNER